MVGPVVAVLQRHGDQPLAVSLRTAHQRPPSSLCIAGFQPQAVIHITQQLVVVVHGPPADGNGPGGGDPHQRLVFQGGPGQLCHVPGGGIMVLVVQAVGIGKGGIFHLQFPGLFVHQRHKALHTAAHMLGDGHRRIVAGAEQQSIQQGLQGQGLPLFQVHGGTFGTGRLPADLHRILKISLLNGHQRRQDFGGAGDEHFPVGIALIKHPAAARIHQDRGGRRGFHRGYPARVYTVQAQCCKGAAKKTPQQKASLPKLRCL